ncbi:MAG: lactate utilization protein [Proteobacteria bacterium]|nr:lactate utilization protein [Pseudomonadota bacterium]
MEIKTERFMETARKELNDPQSQTFLALLPVVLSAVRLQGMSTFTDSEAASAYGAAVRSEAVARLPELLRQLEKNVQANGVKVVWARDAEEANQAILKIAQDNDIRYTTKGKSMVTEELGTNDVLIENGIQVFESDLGELIIQLLGRPPFHMVGPAINVPVEEVRDIFLEKGVMEKPTLDPTELGQAARSFLREKFHRLEMGITGVNMAVAETGTIINVENEGNIRFSKSSPRIQVSVMSLEKVVPTMDDALYMLRLLCRNCTGQKLSAYVTMDTGPKKADEVDGPEELYLVIVDNGRSKMLQDPEVAEAFQCIRCGACQNICPVYGKVGGYAYGWAYSGPIGQVLNPLFLGLDRTQVLFRACTGCGRCKEVCPGGLDHPRMLQYYRQRDVESDPKYRFQKRPWQERRFFKLWSRAVGSGASWNRSIRLMRPFLNRSIEKGTFRNWVSPLDKWLDGRDLPTVSRKTFHERWRELRTLKTESDK